MFLRTVFHLLRARRRPALGLHEVGRLTMRVLPNDLDVLGHMNNGVYFSLMDLGRMDLLIRAGVWATFRRLGYYPVAASETITFRRSLQPWQRYTIESRIVGYDAKSVFVEQRFVVGAEVHAVAFQRARILQRGGRPVAMSDLADTIGVDPTSLPVPEWLAAWAEGVALPPSRATHASDWNEPE